MSKQSPMFLAVLLALAATGCAAGRESAFQKVNDAPTAPVPATAADQAASERAAADAAFAKRDDPAQLELAIRGYEKLAALDPKNGEVRALLSRACYFKADAFLRAPDKKEEMLATFEKGTTWGEEALVVLSPAFAKRAAANEKFEDAVASADPAAVGALYWYAANLGKWARAQGFGTVLGNKEKIKSTMERVLAIDEKYFFGAPHRYFGAYYSVAPTFAGGDVAKSKEHFEKSLALAPSYLGTKLLMADTYAVKTQNKALFQQLLQEILAAPEDAVPEVAPEARVEKAKAKELLARIDDLF